ncbi:MAG: PepSY domain-containing protein [Pseudomonadota bacterium]
MTRTCTLLTGLATAVSLGLLAASPAAASGFSSGQDREEQGEARQQMKAGNQLSLREIERRIKRKMGKAEYVGSAYDKTARAYRLKFVKNGRVMYVDVDARTGRIIKQTR